MQNPTETPESVANSLLNPSQDEKVILAMDIPPEELRDTKPILEGACRFTINYWRVANHPISSPILHNPNWKDLLNACNELLQDGDGFGVYLEGFHLEETNPEGTKEYLLHIGS
jgi:hypothetical protein